MTVLPLEIKVRGLGTHARDHAEQAWGQATGRAATGQCPRPPEEVDITYSSQTGSSRPWEAGLSRGAKLWSGGWAPAG